MKGGAGPRVQNVRTRGSPDTEEPRRQREPGQEHGCPHNRRKETVRRWRIPHAACCQQLRSPGGELHSPCRFALPGRDATFVLQGQMLTIGMSGTGG